MKVVGASSQRVDGVVFSDSAMTDPFDLPAWLERDDASTVPVLGSCSIGRAPGNQLVLADEKASRKHALIHRQGEHEYWLVDLGSSNGSYLDGRRVSQPMALRDGAVIQIGSSTLTFRLCGEACAISVEPHWSEGTVRDIRIAPCWLLLADIEGSTELSRSLPPGQLPVITGRWFSECKQVIESNGGAINKYLGDGFFAYWIDIEGMLPRLVGALGELKRLQRAAQPPFRVVIHHGDVSMGGAASMGEESLSGPEVNFVFRMEKLAGSLKHSNMMSARAGARILDRMPTEAAGRHPLSGFDGEFAFLKF
jgi:adenylate cyclase